MPAHQEHPREREEDPFASRRSLAASGLGESPEREDLAEGIGLFLVFFSAYDAVAGIGTGLAMRSARDLSAAHKTGHPGARASEAVLIGPTGRA